MTSSDAGRAADANIDAGGGPTDGDDDADADADLGADEALVVAAAAAAAAPAVGLAGLRCRCWPDEGTGTGELALTPISLRSLFFCQGGDFSRNTYSCAENEARETRLLYMCCLEDTLDKKTYGVREESPRDGLDGTANKAKQVSKVKPHCTLLLLCCRPSRLTLRL